MMWTREKPTEPGFYFYHPNGTDPRHVWIAQVTDTKANGLHFSTADFRRTQGAIHWPISEAKGMWWGPIAAPPPCIG